MVLKVVTKLMMIMVMMSTGTIVADAIDDGDEADDGNDDDVNGDNSG